MISRRARGMGLAALLCVASAELIARGPVRALLDNSQDLPVHYAGTRVWLEGGDPYDGRQVVEAYLRGGGPMQHVPTSPLPSPYPPVTYAVEVPLALHDWRTSVIVMQVATLVLVALALAALARMAGLHGRRAILFLTGGLALAPLHTGMALAQVTVPSAALLVLGWTCMARRPALSGALVAIGAALKPQLAIPFGLAALARPNARWLASAAGVFLGLFGVAELRLALGGHDPIQAIHDWVRSVAALGAPGAQNSPGLENPSAMTLIGLEMLFARVLPEPALAKVAPLAFAAPLTAIALWRMRGATGGRSELYPLSLLCVAALLATYHRVYDAVLLWIPLAAFVGDWDEIERPLRIVGAAAFAAFLVPGPTILAVLAESGRIPRAVVDSAAWRLAIIPHQVWLLSAAALALTYMLARARPRTDAPVESGASVQQL